ncbi:hypothetical protein [Nocardiopsis aegyptia]|uniref:Uncharacterized protein n=1 Tax=Nocardiopsis aegyptia TaxID=220378 RepID=A0A7Z0EKE9_9ACTN|nr:hypothetical protein [Nocardiopsis aegyptia]NYJ32923.1 hypothetical protein [Nocardiopsis aegyptia]
MTDREPDRGPEERSGASPDPVNHRPPEEWRPGDPGDPMGGGAQPPGEPPHEYPRGSAPGEHPTGAPPEPITGEYSEGPSGASQAGFEHAGYAPGYGEADEPGAGPGSYPPIGQPWSGTAQAGPGAGQTGPQAGAPTGQPTGPQAAQPGWTQPPGYGQPGGAYGRPPHYVQGPGYGQGTPSAGYGSYAYGPPEEKSTPWGKIIGIGCGALLVVMLVSAVVSVLMFILVGVDLR